MRQRVRTRPAAPRGAPAMEIRLKKGRDGRDTLACHRADGTATWAALHPSQPLHDLTHFAVETTLGLADAFFGLLARGWAIEDFGDRQQLRLMPAEALYAEVLVGQLDLERLPGNRRPWEAFDASLRLALAGQGVAPRPFTAETLERIRARRAALVAAWARLRPGETLTLSFPE